MKKIDSKKLFGFNCEFDIFAFDHKTQYVPDIDKSYIFDPETTKAILAGFAFNQRVLVQGMHGTGKSTHIEQVAARLNWPCLRINFDSQITRLDLVGKDVIHIKDGKQITEFMEGMLPFTINQGMVLVLDEYDAIRSDVSFIIQRLLEEEGKFALLEENKILTPHKNFRLFATSNTLGDGDDLGIYHGANLINQAQMDRWNILISLNYLDESHEVKVLQKKLPNLYKKDKNTLINMVKLANLTREAFKNADLSTLMSLRTLISWGRNIEIFRDINNSFKLSFYNKVAQDERILVNELFQRVYGQEIV
jgi:cobaltochelatase CobS